MIAASGGRWVRSNGSAARGAWDFGNSQPLWMRHERIELFGDARAVRILYASDLHLGVRSTGRLVQDLIGAAELALPKLILLGGDLVDSGPGLRWLRYCVQSLSAVAPVCGIGGNHDHVFGMVRVRRALELGGGTWLEDQSHLVPFDGNRTVRIDGALNADSRAADSTILCAHDPEVFPCAARTGYRLVLAGHLHGSQCVLAERNGMLYPGAWFFRWNGLRFSQNGCQMLVSRGMADTLPLRWNCPREVVLCELY